jgi:outer membrane lipoprotein-sorting protein
VSKLLRRVLTLADSASNILAMPRPRHAAHPDSIMRKLAFLFLSVLLALPAAAQSADDILAKYLVARGGLDKIKAVQSERVTGTISFGPGEEGPFVVERARTLKMHMEFNLNGGVIIRTYDGKSTGWTYNSFVPNPTVQPMSEADLRNIFEEADFDGPFVDYKSKGNQIELAGKEDVEGKPADKLKLTNRNGDISYFFFDATSHLVLECQGSRQFDSKDIPWVTFFRDFREVKGLKYPFLIEYEEPGTENAHKITADKIEVNIPIDEARFGKPNPPPPPPPPAPPAELPAEPPKLN